MSLGTPVAAPPEDVPARARPGLDLLLRVAGVAISLVATVLTAVLELFLSPLRIGGVQIWVAVLVAAAANWAICWFAVTSTARRWAVAPPWALWTLIMFLAGGYATAEGDRLIDGNDMVALVMILAGSVSFAAFTYRTILRSPPPPRPRRL